MANSLMFEVGVSNSVKDLDKLKTELDNFINHYTKGTAIKLQIEIDNLQAVTTQLSKIGDSPQLRNLRQEIESLNKEFVKMAAGAGGAGDLPIRAAKQEVAGLKVELDNSIGKLQRLNEELDVMRRNKDAAKPADKGSYVLPMQNLKDQIAAQEEIIKKRQAAYDKAVADANKTVEANNSAAVSYRELKTSIDDMKRSLSNPNVNTSNDAELKKLQGDLDKVRQEADASQKTITELTEKLNNMATAQNKVAEATAKTGKSEQQIGDSQNALFNRYNKLLGDIQNIKREIVEIQRGAGGGGPFGDKLGEYFSSLNRIRNVAREITSSPSVADAITKGMSSEQLAKLNSALAALKTNFKEVIADAKDFNKATDKGSSQAEARIRKLGMAFNELKNYMRQNGGSEEMKRLQTEIQGAIRKMRDLMNAGNFAGAINVYERLSGIIRQAATATKEFERAQHQAVSAISHLTASEQQLANAIKGSTDNMKGQSQVMSDLKTMATQYLGVWGAQGFLRNVIEIGGQLEMQRLSIGAILGDMAKATELFDRIKNLAVKSPFGVVELDQMTKQLSAYGFEYNELFDMTKRLADISAATGTSVDRLALALGHVRSEAALSGYTLRQFSMANIPLAKKLSEELTKVEGKLVSVADVRKRVRTKDIGYEQVLKVLKDLTDEGGMFYNAQEIMSESVKARFKNLKDSMDIMYGEIAESSVGKGLKEVASLLTTLTRHWQELGGVLVAGAGYWALNRVSMMAANKAMVQGNLTLGRFSASQLEMQATTGNLTRAQLLQAVATKKLAVADAEAAAAVLGLSRAQLQHVANTGKVASAMNMATIATSKYTMSQLRMIATWRQFNFGWLATGLVSIKTGAQAAAVAIGGLLKSLWPMLAISAVIEMFMSLKRETEQFADAANYVGQAARNMMKDIDEAIDSVSKNGKPIDTEALREAVNTMKEVLENSEFYTAEQQKQVDNAKTLSDKYDILLRQMKEMREEAEWQTNSEGLIEKILANTGKNVKTNTAQNWNSQTGTYETVVSQTFGSRFFNDSLQENIEQVNKSNAALQSAINLLSEYQNVIQDAIKKNDNFGLSLDGKSWQEQVRIIAESGKWDEFVASVENAGSRFEKTAVKVKDASEKVRDDWQEIVDDDVKAIRLTLMQEWGMTEDEINEFAKNNERTMRWLVDAIAKSLSKLGVAEKIIDEFKRKILELFGVASSGKPVQQDLNEYQKQTDLAKRVLGNVIRHNKNNGKNGQGVSSVAEINKIVGTGNNVKTESEVVKALKEQAQKDHEKMKDIWRIYGETSKEYASAKKKYEHSLNLAESNGIKESEILTGKYKDKKDGSKGDEAAKVLRERVRILKEAADSYQYWREKVGESGAESRMQGEFGQLLTEQNLQLRNADELKAKLKELREEYSKKPQTKAMVEAIKEIDKEIAKLDRKDFERDTERFLSKTQIELDNLTRSWETFNSVREATGDVQLAIELSGAEYANGKTQNLADAIREKIQKDFASVGAIPIPFDINMHDEQIGDAIKAAMPKASEDQIKGFVEEYKKWRDLQRQVRDEAIKAYASMVADIDALKSRVAKVNDEYVKQIEHLRTLKMLGTLDEDQYKNETERAERTRKLGYAEALVDSTDWSKSFGIVGNVLKTQARELREELKKMISSKDFGKLNAAEQQKYLSLQKKLYEGGQTATSPFNLGAWGDLQELSKKLQGYTKGLIEAMKDLIYWTNEEAQAEKDYNSAKGPAKMVALARLVQARQNKAQAQQKVQENQTGAVQTGEDIEEAGDNAVKGLNNFSTALGEVTAGSLSSLVLGIGNIIKVIKGDGELANSVGELFGKAGEKVGGLIGAILQIIDMLGDEPAKFIDDLFTKISKVVEAVISQLPQIIGSAIKGVGNIIGSAIDGVGSLFGIDFGISDLFNPDGKLQKQIEALEANNKALQANTSAILSARERTLGYDVDAIRKRMRDMYKSTGERDFNWMFPQNWYMEGFNSLAEKAMNDFYGKEGVNGYSQQLENLKEQRENLLRMYDAEYGKKDRSQEALEDYKQQIAELDDQIMFFAEDLSKELFGLDLKGWADQIGDSLMTAFENGEDAAEAFNDTVRDIMRQVLRNMLTVGMIEPMMEKLRKKLFGENGVGGSFDAMNPEGTIDAAMRDITEFFGEGGEGQAMIEATKTFYDKWQSFMQSKGLSLDTSDTSSSSVGGGIKSITEQTADILAAYLNSCRADLSVVRNLQGQYFPMFYQTITSSNASLTSIAQHTEAIMRSNQIVADKITSLDNNINGLKNKTWKVPMA